MITNTRTSLSDQQKQSLKFFDEKAEEWERKADGKINNKVNVVRQRNDYVLHVVRGRKKTEYVLDVGCGVGDLSCEIAKMGINVTGIDIAGGMVDLAHGRAVDAKLDLVEFITGDYFDHHVDPESYDLMAANGFIEYISGEQRDNYFSDAYRILKPGGSLVVSSRNRLFNLVSANEYTRAELAMGGVKPLLREAISLVEGVSIDQLISMESVQLQPEDMTHGATGIEVATRFQYTPSQLTKMLHNEGFEVLNFSPIHIHAGSPEYKKQYPDMHYRMANFMQKEAIENWSLIPSASAFMVHARKA